MKQNKGYNRNISGGKRRKKKIQRYGKYKTLSERLLAESVGLDKYEKRIGRK